MCYQNFEEDGFIQEVKDMNFMDVYMCEDASQATEILTKKLNSVLDRMAPVKKVQIRQNYAPWVTDACKSEMAARDAAQARAKNSGLDTDWEAFRAVRNSVTRKVRKQKENWRKMAGCQANSSSCWKNILGWLGWSSSGSPTMLYHGHRVENSPNKMANIMNNFYVNKVANIHAALPQPSEDPLAQLHKLMAGNTAPQFSLLPVHPDTVHWKNSKASGWDSIDTYIVKLISKEIVPSLYSHSEHQH